MNGTQPRVDDQVELMNTYSRQFRYVWKGGNMVTRCSTIGGTLRDGIIRQSNVEVLDGDWEATDTTERYVYGITLGREKGGVTRLQNGGSIVVPR